MTWGLAVSDRPPQRLKDLMREIVAAVTYT
jgi:hypothetical protein